MEMPFMVRHGLFASRDLSQASLLLACGFHQTLAHRHWSG
jgi:hypothetical protein